MLTCLVCRSVQVHKHTITHNGNRTRKTKRRRKLSVQICKQCGHVAAPGNVKDYSKFTSFARLALRPRVGTQERPGREFYMATMAADVLDRDGLSVLVYGPGRSVDYRWIKELDPVKRVAVGDVMRLIDDAEWVDLSAPAGERFDIVIACEVIEHFTDPLADFEKLFSYVDDNGLVVCSTSIYDGGDLSRQGYLFTRGHTSYYTPGAIAHLAKEHNMYVDFRLPKIATGRPGPRKRYIVFSRSPERMRDLVFYFGSNVFAPSEDT